MPGGIADRKNLDEGHREPKERIGILALELRRVCDGLGEHGTQRSGLLLGTEHGTADQAIEVRARRR